MGMTCGSSGERKQEVELDGVWRSVWRTADSAGWSGRTMETVDRETEAWANNGGEQGRVRQGRAQDEARSMAGSRRKHGEGGGLF